VENYFSMLSGLSEGVPWTRETLPLLFGYSNRTKPFDIPFDEVRQNLLDLDVDIADMIMRLEIRIRQLNGFLTESTERFSDQSKNHDEILRDLKAHKRVHIAFAEYVRLLAFASRTARKQLFDGRKKVVVDWSSIEAKYHEIDKLFLEGSTGLTSHP